MKAGEESSNMSDRILRAFLFLAAFVVTAFATIQIVQFGLKVSSYDARIGAIEQFLIRANQQAQSQAEAPPAKK